MMDRLEKLVFLDCKGNKEYPENQDLEGLLVIKGHTEDMAMNMVMNMIKVMDMVIKIIMDMVMDMLMDIVTIMVMNIPCLVMKTPCLLMIMEQEWQREERGGK